MVDCFLHQWTRAPLAPKLINGSLVYGARGLFLDMVVSTLAEAQSAFRILSDNNAHSCLLTFTHPEFSPDISHNGLPIVSRGDFSQLTHNQLNNQLGLLATGPLLPRVQKYSTVESGDVLQYVTRIMRLTRGRLMKQDNWTDWQHSDYLQLNQYWDQGCLGMPTAVDQNNIVFHLVWTYNIKAVDGRKKAHCVCNGSNRSGSVKVLDEVYANCVDQTSACLFYAVAAAENFLSSVPTCATHLQRLRPQNKASARYCISNHSRGCWSAGIHTM